eukprot:GHVU01128129.1.p2 GENE.GHVU01128129.1~~GHVU01128129.1.p2  ORF type:complete len:134 (-),score=11.00 GHVU01128129.1:143-544(-)
MRDLGRRGAVARSLCRSFHISLFLSVSLPLPPFLLLPPFFIASYSFVFPFSFSFSPHCLDIRLNETPPPSPPIDIKDSDRALSPCMRYGSAGRRAPPVGEAPPTPYTTTATLPTNDAPIGRLAGDVERGAALS